MSIDLDSGPKNLSPQQIVEELDRFIVGQKLAKKSVAIALRNRWRRKAVPSPLCEEIVPKNILMIGPTGVGKTEIARRLAKLAGAPFIKVEATKFTEVGYVGRDVESIIRDLIEVAITLLKDRYKQQVRTTCEEAAYEKVLDALVGKGATPESREKFYRDLVDGKLDHKEIEIQIKENSINKGHSFDIPNMPGMAMGILNIGDMLSKTLGGSKTKLKKMSVKDALEICIEEELEKLIDEEKIVQKALHLTENEGIVFLDEIDKITSATMTKGGEVSREGVQRDLLPLIEGTTVNTRYGAIKTDHILFIASGAFHLSKPSDLLPELQGRLPIRVELKALTKEDIIKILTEPENNLIKQYQALLVTENIELEFTTEGINQIAEAVILFNEQVENIGARRLHTILEKLLEDISFHSIAGKKQKFLIDHQFVDNQLVEFKHNTDLARFIL